jgi:hypothetical protein
MTARSVRTRIERLEVDLGVAPLIVIRKSYDPGPITAVQIGSQTYTRNRDEPERALVDRAIASVCPAGTLVVVREIRGPP